MGKKKTGKVKKKRTHKIEVKTQPRSWSRLGKGWKILVLVGGTIGAVAAAFYGIQQAFVFLRPNISLELERKDPANFFDSFIKVTNEGNFTLYNVQAVHWAPKIEFASGFVIENASAGDSKFTDLGDLEPEEPSTTFLGEAFSFSSPPDIVEGQYCTNIHFSYFFFSCIKRVGYAVDKKKGVNDWIERPCTEEEKPLNEIISGEAVTAQRSLFMSVLDQIGAKIFSGCALSI